MLVFLPWAPIVEAAIIDLDPAEIRDHQSRDNYLV